MGCRSEDAATRRAQAHAVADFMGGAERGSDHGIEEARLLASQPREFLEPRNFPSARFCLWPQSFVSLLDPFAGMDDFFQSISMFFEHRAPHTRDPPAPPVPPPRHPVPPCSLASLLPLHELLPLNRQELEQRCRLAHAQRQASASEPEQSFRPRRAPWPTWFAESSVSPEFSEDHAPWSLTVAPLVPGWHSPAWLPRSLATPALLQAAAAGRCRGPLPRGVRDVPQLAQISGSDLTNAPSAWHRS